MFSAWLATITAMATVIEPVGPEMRDRVPPNTAAKKPTEMAPYIPAAGPRPAASPKANATGRPTTAAVTPPRTSPRSSCRPYCRLESDRRLSKSGTVGGTDHPYRSKLAGLWPASTSCRHVSPMNAGIGLVGRIASIQGGHVNTRVNVVRGDPTDDRYIAPWTPLGASPHLPHP